MAKKKMTLEKKLEEAIVKDAPYEVPENWQWIEIGSIIEVVSGGTPKTNIAEYYDNGDIAWITPADLSGYNNIYISKGKRNITELGLEKSSAKLMPKDSVLMSSRAPIGYVVIAENDICTNQGFKSFLPSPIYMPKYLFYYLKYSKELIESLGSGTTFLELSGAKAKTIPFPVAPLKEQQRIVDKIESLFEKLDKSKELIEEARDDFENRTTAILESAFNGTLTASFRKNNKLESIGKYLEEVKLNRIQKYEKAVKIAKEKGDKKPKKDYEFIIETDETLPIGWVRSKLDNLIYMAARIGWKGLKASEYTEEGPMFLSVYNLNYGDNVVFDKVYHISDERYEESPEIKVKLEDILLTKDGAGIGKLGFVKELPSEATINSSLLLLRSNEAVLPRYLFYFFKGPQLQRLVKERITGSAIPHLFQRDIKEFYLAIPPIREQREIVRILDKLLEEEAKIEELTTLEGQIELIKKSILAKAFRGQLGTNCEEDESALELLKAILDKE